MVVHIDQKLRKQTGIICDLCGAVSVDKFEYFSAKFDLVEVDRAVGKTGIKKIDRQNLDLDICVSCMDKIKGTVIDGIKKRENQGAWSTSVETKALPPPPKVDEKPKPSTPRMTAPVAQKVIAKSVEGVESMPIPPAAIEAFKQKVEGKPPEVAKDFQFFAVSVVKEPVNPACVIKEPEPPPKPPLPAPKPPTPPKMTRPAALARPDLPPGPAAPTIKKQEPPK